MKTLTAMLLILILLSVGSEYKYNLNQVSSNTLDQYNELVRVDNVNAEEKQ